MKHKHRGSARKPDSRGTLTVSARAPIASAVTAAPAPSASETYDESEPLRRTGKLRAFWTHGWLPGVVLFAAIVLAYLPSWRAGFIWDDDAHLTQNPCIVGPLGFKEIWTSSAAVYYPLVLTNFWVQHALWGLHPVPYHLVNIAMHAACDILLWQVLRCLRVPGAWFGAALWGLHPVMAESVAWITELKNTQSCFFYLLSILFFVRWLRVGTFVGSRNSEVPFVLALACAACAILSKASTVMLPVVLGLCWWWANGPWKMTYVIRLAPFLLISAGASAWTIWEQKFHSGALGPEWNQSWPERFILAGKAVWFYLGKLALPHPLIFIYPRWQIAASHITDWLPAVAAIAALIALWKWQGTRPRAAFFAFAYFAVSLFPVLDFFNVYFFRYSFVGDHLQYLASMGPLALAGAAISVWFERFNRVVTGPRAAILEPVFCASLLLMLGLLSFHEAKKYQSNATLWHATLAQNPGAWLAYESLGNDLLRENRVEEAIVDYQTALKMRPDLADPYNDLAVALIKKGRIDEAVGLYQKALEIQPAIAEIHYNLGNAMMRQGKVEDAFAHYEQALAIRPDYAEVHINLGSVLLQQGRIPQVVSHYEQALKLRPDFGGAWNNLAQAAWVLATSPDDSIRDGGKAVEWASRANELSGGKNPQVLATLAAAYAEVRRFPDAAATVRQALELESVQASPAFANTLRGQLEMYQAGKPFRNLGPASTSVQPGQQYK